MHSVASKTTFSSTRTVPTTTITELKELHAHYPCNWPITCAANIFLCHYQQIPIEVPTEMAEPEAFIEPEAEVMSLMMMASTTLNLSGLNEFEIIERTRGMAHFLTERHVIILTGNSSFR